MKIAVYTFKFGLLAAFLILLLSPAVDVDTFESGTALIGLLSSFIFSLEFVSVLAAASHRAAQFLIKRFSRGEKA